MSTTDFLAATDIANGLTLTDDQSCTFKTATKTALDDQTDNVQIIKTACRACISNCGVLATVKNGRVVHLEGNPEDPMSKGHMCA